jgi:hypothetical protein
MRRIVKELGTDTYGKAWKVLVAEWKLRDTDGSLAADRIVFLVFPRNARRKNMKLDSPRVLEAWIQKPFDAKAFFGDICHAERFGERFYQLSGPRTLTTSLVSGCDHASKNSQLGKWERHGIAILLLGYIEQWAIQSGIETLFGFISKHDDVERLKSFWLRRGYTIGAVSEEDKREYGSFYVAKAAKDLKGGAA